MSNTGGPLQVVPDIDDICNDSKTDDDDSSSVLLSDIPTVDRENQTRITDLAQVMNSDSDRQPKEKSPACRRRHISSHPPIHRINDDAQPLTPTEMMTHRQLLSQHRS